MVSGTVEIFSLSKILQKIVETGWGHLADYLHMLMDMSQAFPNGFSWNFQLGTHLDTYGYCCMYLLYRYEPYYMRKHTIELKNSWKSWIFQKLIFSQTSFCGVNLITQVSQNILKSCISGHGLWKYSMQNFGGNVYIIIFSNSESQSLSATCTSNEPRALLNHVIACQLCTKI